MKMIIAFVLAIIVILSMSAVCFADTDMVEGDYSKYYSYVQTPYMKEHKIVPKLVYGKYAIWFGADEVYYLTKNAIDLCAQAWSQRDTKLCSDFYFTSAISKNYSFYETYRSFMAYTKNAHYYGYTDNGFIELGYHTKHYSNNDNFGLYTASGTIDVIDPCYNVVALVLDGTTLRTVMYEDKVH